MDMIHLSLQYLDLSWPYVQNASDCWPSRGYGSSVSQLCPTLCDPMACSTPGLPVHHQLPKFTQTHVYWVSDAIQPSHPLLSPSPPASIFPSVRSFQMSQFFTSGGQSPANPRILEILKDLGLVLLFCKWRNWSPEWEYVSFDLEGIV